MRFLMLTYPGPKAEAEGSPVPDGPEGQKLTSRCGWFALAGKIGAHR